MLENILKYCEVKKMLLYDEFTIEQLSYVKVHSVDIVLFIYCYDLNITFSSIYCHGYMVYFSYYLHNLVYC